MTITARGNSWLVSVGSGKDRKRITVKTKAEAEALERNLMQAQLEAQYRAVQAAQRGDPSKTLKDAYDKAVRDVWKGAKSERSALINAGDMRALFSPDRPLTEIDSELIDDVLDILDERGLSGATVNRKISALNVMLTVAHARKWITDIPKMPRRAESKGRIYWYNDAEEQQMLDACDHLGLVHLRKLVSFAISTGLRRAELLGLKVEDVQGGALRLHHGETKNSDARTIPLIESAQAIVDEAKAAGHTRVFESLNNHSLRSQWDAMTEYLGKRGDPKYIVHVLRHTTATRLALRGANGFQIMAYMGHKAIQTSMRYVHLVGSDLADVASLLERPEARS